jgi:CBS domain containing-hemolysin-like protein
MIAFPLNVTLDRLADIMERHHHSRYPVFEGTPDNIVGVLAPKHLVAALAKACLNGSVEFDIRRHMTAPLFVPETMHADMLLAEMKQRRTHLAIVIDEYGVTAGIVTLRDLMDRIAGEVPDESEVTLPMVEWLADGSAMFDGLALLSDVEAELDIEFGESDYDTLGGLIFGRLGRRPAVGDKVEAAGRIFIIEELDGFRVSRVRVQRASEGATLQPGDEQAVPS